MTVREKMHQTELYLPTDPSIWDEQMQCLTKLCDYNLTRPYETEKREALLRELFAPAPVQVVQVPTLPGAAAMCTWGNMCTRILT